MKSTFSDIERVVLHEVFHEWGLIPLERATANVRDLLATLDAPDSREASRKFRKLWRKEYKIEKAEVIARAGKSRGMYKDRLEHELKALDARWGVGVGAPTSAVKNLRKNRVFMKAVLEMQRRVALFSTTLNK